MLNNLWVLRLRWVYTSSHVFLMGVVRETKQAVRRVEAASNFKLQTSNTVCVNGRPSGEVLAMEKSKLGLK